MLWVGFSMQRTEYLMTCAEASPVVLLSSADLISELVDIAFVDIAFAVSALVDALLESYDVERARAAADVIQFVEELLALGALETQEPT